MMSEKKYLWYKIKPFATSVSETYDEKKDEDLLRLCKNIPDILFQIFNTPQDGTTITIRVPEFYGETVEAVDSFGSVFNDSPIGMKIDVLSTLRLAEKSAYPLVYDKKNIDSHIFSSFMGMPYGVFGLKLLHAPSSLISKQYNSIRKKNKKHEEKNISKIDPYEKFVKQKSECTSFFYCEIFYGVKSFHDEETYKNGIPYLVERRKPNSLLQSKRIIFTDKHQNKANDYYEKLILTKSKKTSMILSDLDLLPFIRFSENPYSIGLDSAQTPTSSNVIVSEKEFGNFDEEFKLKE